MITKNFKARVATLLQMTTNNSNPGGYTGLLSVKDVGGTTRYICCYYNNNSFPHNIAYSVTFSANANGIQIGTGNTAATEDDYKLETQITSGMSASYTTATCGVDSSGNTYIEYLFILTNTTSSDITVREIGYVQQFRLADTQGGSLSSTNHYLLLDRTVLDTPVTVPAGDSAAIKYRLKTVLASS